MSQEHYPSRRKRVFDLLGALERDVDHRAAILYEVRQALEAYFVDREEVFSHGVRAVLGARVAAMAQEHARCRAAFARLVELRYEGFDSALVDLRNTFVALDDRSCHTEARRAA